MASLPSKNYVARAYNSFSVDGFRSVIKKTSKEKRLFDEASFYKEVPENLSIFFPRLVSSGFHSGSHYIELELYPYSNLGRYLVGDLTLTQDQWVAVAKHLYEVLLEFSATRKYNYSLDTFVGDMRSMYFDKTEREYQNLITKFERFGDIAKQKELVLNGKSYLNFDQVWTIVKDKCEKVLVDPGTVPCVMHGDCCFSNILLGLFPDRPDTILKFVDPRGLFGDMKVYGDPYYDLAKLMHSTDVGYEYFIYDKFDVKEPAPYNYTLTYTNNSKDLVHSVFQEHIYSKFNLTKIKLIQGLIYVGMCARHYDDEQRQLAMYLSGIKLLNEVVQQQDTPT